MSNLENSTTLNGVECIGKAQIVLKEDGVKKEYDSWYGHFKVTDKLFDDWTNFWKGKSVKYKGVFTYKDEETIGMGKGIISNVIESDTYNKVIVAVKSDGDPAFENEIIK